MFDIWFGDVNLTLVLIALSAFILLPVQLLLCFKVKSLLVRLLPVILFAMLSVVFFILTQTITGWDVLFWLICLIYSIFITAVCALGWGIYALVRLLAGKRRER